jgi:hypothetical protein
MPPGQNGYFNERLPRAGSPPPGPPEPLAPTGLPEGIGANSFGVSACLLSLQPRTTVDTSANNNNMSVFMASCNLCLGLINNFE